MTSLLIGIAIDRKLIGGVDEPAVKFFPEFAALKTPGWDSITLRHLLTMSSGIKWDENLPWTDPRNDEPHLGKDPDPIRYFLAKPIAAPSDVGSSLMRQTSLAGPSAFEGDRHLAGGCRHYRRRALTASVMRSKTEKTILDGFRTGALHTPGPEAAIREISVTTFVTATVQPS